jgi:hypothetical protein
MWDLETIKKMNNESESKEIQSALVSEDLESATEPYDHVGIVSSSDNSGTVRCPHCKNTCRLTRISTEAVTIEAV